MNRDERVFMACNSVVEMTSYLCKIIPVTRVARDATCRACREAAKEAGMFPPRLTGVVHRGRVELNEPDVLAVFPLTEDIVYLNRVWRLEVERRPRPVERLCPICWQPAKTGYHAAAFHALMPKAEQERRLRWFSEEEAIEWLKRGLERLEEFEQ